MDNLSQKAYGQIKEMILEGTLQQGQLISINKLTEMLQISRTPLTSAFQRLENEKFITIIPKQGVIVNTVSLETAREIYELRAAIETYNAKRVFPKMDATDLAALEDSLARQEARSQCNDTAGFMKEDIWFHKYILNKVSNFEFMSVIDVLFERAYLLGLSNSGHHRMEESITEHRQILSALKGENPQGFADAIECNILNGFRNLTKIL